MNEEELKLFAFLNKNKLKTIEINHEYGNVYFNSEDGRVITFIGFEDGIGVDYSDEL